jgi:hypothetical protein
MGHWRPGVIAMAGDLAVDFFKAGKTQLEAYFHIAIVTPYGIKTAEQIALTRDLERQLLLAKTVLPIGAQVQLLISSTLDQSQKVTTEFRDGLSQRVKELVVVAQKLAELGEDRASGEEGSKEALLFEDDAA